MTGSLRESDDYITPVKDTPRPFADSAAARIESDFFHETNRIEMIFKKNQTVICIVCKTKIGDRLYPIKCININEVSVQERGNHTLPLYSDSNTRKSLFYHTCKTFTSKHNFSVHRNSNNHRRYLHKR